MQCLKHIKNVCKSVLEHKHRFENALLARLRRRADLHSRYVVAELLQRVQHRLRVADLIGVLAAVECQSLEGSNTLPCVGREAGRAGGVRLTRTFKLATRGRLEGVQLATYIAVGCL